MPSSPALIFGLMLDVKVQQIARIEFPVQLGNFPLKTEAVQEDAKVKRIGLCFKLVPHKLYTSKLYIPSQDVGYATFRNMDRK